MRKNLIFSNDFDKKIFDWIIKDYCNCNDIKENTLSDTDKWQIYYDNLDVWYAAEKMSLNKKLDGNVLVIADLGLWNGRCSGYKILKNNLNEILNISGETIEIFAENRNIKAVVHHHDGTNYYTFRKIRADKNINKLLEKLYENEEVSTRTINYYTESLYKDVKNIYGW